MLDPMLDVALLGPEHVRPLHRREYEDLIELGAFNDERVELLRGVLIEMSMALRAGARCRGVAAHAA